MAEAHHTKELHISVVTERLDIIFPLTPETIAEEVIVYVCKALKIGPVTRHLFGLRVSKKYWVALNNPLWGLSTIKLYFRVRFKVPNSDKLRQLDPQAFNYYFNQVRRDVLDSAVPGISCDVHKRELMGLGVTDMYRDILENGISRSEVLNNYKKYIPKEIAKTHLIFARKEMDKNLNLLSQQGVTDVLYLKSGYLEEFEGIAPEYLIEEYEARIMESEASKVITIKVNPYHDDMPGILYKSSDLNEWQHICSIEDLCFISLKDDGSVEISRKTGIPLYILFQSFSITISFVTLLDGYYRLSIKWTFNLCKNLFTPSLLKLKKLKCHGPVGGEFSYAKLEEKCNKKPGCFILRESETSFDNYYIDVCTKKSNTPVTYSIICKTDGTFWFSADKESYVSIQAIIDKYSSSSKNVSLLECLPSSEYEESNLLLCQQTESKPSTCSAVQFQNHSHGPTRCIHVKDLQIFRGKMLDDSQFTQLYKCFWKRNKKEKVEVALKSLKAFYQDRYWKSFLKLASDWGLLQSSSFVNLLGVTLSDPISMVMEYFPMGPLDKYLQNNKKLIKEVDLVEAATYLANALWLMEEEGFVHGYIRCEKILVASHSDNSFCVRLSDPGLFQNYEEYDLHWIPPELHDYPEVAKKKFSADIWAFGTTLWEIFAYGEKPPCLFVKDVFSESYNVRQYYKSGNRLKSPKNCPRNVYNLIEECWHSDPFMRKKPQAAKRDINQFLYQVFNSRLKHSYATIMPTTKSKSSSFDTLNDVSSDTLDGYSLKSLSTQLSYVSWCDDSSSPQISCTFSDIDTDSKHGSQINLATQTTYNFSQVSTMIPSLEFQTSDAQIGGISSLQSIFELSQDVNVVLQGKIGQGFYGEVYQGLIEDINSSSDALTVAVKRLRNFDNSSIVSNSWNNDFLREIDIMKELKHPCIVEMKFVILEPEVNLVMEYVPHGSLKCYLKINKDRLDTKKHILKYALDVAKGMEYLGQMKIVHRDLAARNVLVADEFNVKISDFGLAQFVGPSDYYISQTNRELPVKWFAPESLRYGKFSGQTDVWSYGVTLYEMFSFGEEPIIETLEESSSLLDALDRGMRLPCPSFCPDEVYANLMLQCWQSEGKNRPLFSKIIVIVEQLRNN